ncbi:MAG: hypothetical protein H3C41_05165 [Bacteroidales bacterium]|nr:hypothetical protein [Bacteroidales bacterium]
MKKQIKQFIVIALLLMVSACASRKTIYFDQQIRKNIESYGIDLPDIQFYNSKKIVLARDLSYEETKVASGKIRFENGRFIEKIIIKKRTPGVCENFDDRFLEISFEHGDNTKLKFILDSKDYYRLSAMEWKNRYGKIAYDTTVYYIQPGGEKALLKIKAEDIYRFDRKERVAPGRKLSK